MPTSGLSCKHPSPLQHIMEYEYGNHSVSTVIISAGAGLLENVLGLDKQRRWWFEVWVRMFSSYFSVVFPSNYQEVRGIACVLKLNHFYSVFTLGKVQHMFKK